MSERRVHDYRRRYWGHDYTITPDPDPVTAQIIGFGDGLREHDLLVIPGAAGNESCLYEIETIAYRGDPPDMWFSHCRFVPGTSELGQKAIAALDTRPELSALSLTSWRVLDG